MKTSLLAEFTNHFPQTLTRIFYSISKKQVAALVIVMLVSVFSLKSISQSISVPVITDVPVCAGSTVTATFDVTNGSGAANHFTSSTSYQAYISDAAGSNFIALGTTFSISASYSTADGAATTGLQKIFTIPSNFPTGSGYKISIGSTSPAFSANSGSNASAGFTINALLTPTVSIAINPPTTNNICAGTNVTFTATPVNGGGNPSYQWKKNNTDINGATSSTYSSTALVNGDKISVVLTPDPAICTSASTATSNEITMTVNPVLIPSVSITATTPIFTTTPVICPLTSVNFQATPTNGGTNPTYQWKLNGGNVGNGGASYTTTGLANGDIVTVELTSSAVCASPTNITSNQITATVNPAIPVTPGTITGTTPVCPALTTLTYSITAVANATTYTWAVPSGWSITNGQGTTSITVTSGAPGANGNVTVTAGNSCGTSSASSLAVTVSPAAPAQPAAITGTSPVCPAIAGLTYSIAAVANADANGYVWVVPIGWSITAGQGTTSITVTSGSAGQNGNVSVTASNSCGTSIARTLAVVVSPAAPLTPGTITGSTPVCPALTTLTYSIAAVTNATTYTWAVPSGWSITSGQGSTSITVTSGAPGANGNVTVTAGNSCGTTSASSLAVTVSPAAPAQPAAITGTTPVCPAIAGLTYSIAAVANADANGYVWVVPTGWSITAGQGTTSITVTSGSAAQNGNISVTASNSCGMSTARTLAVVVSPAAPLTPGTITGSTPVCPALTTLTYSIASVTNATTYTWAVPSGWSITSGQGSTSITVTSGAPGANGNVTVTAGNSCGTTSASTLAVTVSPAAPAQPAAITGTTPVCPAIAGLTYSIAAVANADANGYVWAVPTGWSITAGQGTTSITVTAGSAGQNGNVSVTARNSCGTSIARTLAVVVSPGAPSTPGTIAGSTSVCSTPQSAGLIYSVANVANASATGYSWTFPSGWTITNGANTNTVTVTATNAAISGNITVSASNSCGTSTFQTVAVTITPGVLTAPGAITGLTAICPVKTPTYSIAAVPGATSYTWTVPANWSITSGQGTTSITTNVPLSANGQGNISVTANNVCGNSTPATLLVTVSNTATVSAGIDQTICFGQASVNLTGSTGGAIDKANEFEWESLSGGNINVSGGSYTQALTPTFNLPANAAGTLSVVIRSKVNSVGCSFTTDTMKVFILPTPTATISGSTSICTGSSANISFNGTANTTVTYKIGTGANQTVNLNSAGTAILSTGPLSTQTVYTLVSVAYTSGSQTCSTNVSGSATININSLPTITGTLTVCVGSTRQLTGSATAATSNPWVSANTAVASVSNTGLVTGNSAGTTVITYTNSNGCVTTATVTVNALPTITGTLAVCSGSSTQLTGSGTAAASNPWVSATPSVATVNSTGLVSGVAAGTSVITYTNNNGCTINATVTVNALPTITGTLNVCTGLTTQLTGAGTPAGVNPWTSSNTGVASVNNSGLVTGIAAGTSTITYTNDNGCKITASVTINANPTITGTFSVCVGATTQLTGSATPASTNAWVSATLGVATVSTTGLVTGVTTGTSIITYTNSNGCVNTTTVTVNSLPTITGTLTVCVGSTTTLTGSASPAALNAWVSGNTGVASVNASGVVTGVSAGTSVITYTNSNGCTISASVTVNALPAITGTVTVCAGLTTQLAGSGTPDATNPWTSATTSVATVSSSGLVTGVAAGTSVITYTNSNGCVITTTITVNALPTITGTLEVCTGATTQLTGSATPAVSNAWVSANTGVATVSSNGLVSGVTAGTSVITYTNSNGCIITSTITVTAASTVNAGVAQTICSNETAIMAGAFGGGATSATWSTSGTGTFSSNAIDAIYTPSPADIFAGSVTLTYTTNDPLGPCGAANASMLLTIKKAVVITSQPSNIGVCASNPASLGVAATGDNLTYQWYKGIIGSGVAVANSANITGATSPELKFLQASLSDNADYYVIVSGAADCTPVTSSQVSLNVDQSIVITTQPLAQIVCEGATNVIFSVTANAGGEPLSYQWRFNGSNISGANDATYTIGTITLASAGNYDVVITGPTGFTCATITSGTAALAVNQNSTIALTSAPSTDEQIICVNTGLTNITYAVGGGATGASITKGTLPAGVASSFNNGIFTISGTPSVSGTFNYEITTTGPCGNVTKPGSINVTGNASLLLSSATGTNAQTVCIGGGITDITYAVGGSATGASITAGALPAGVTGTFSGGVFIISGAPTVSGTFNYTVTTTGPCVASSLSGTITVNANSTITLNSAAGTDAQTKCVNTAITNITYIVGGGATGASITAGTLPTGVTGAYNSTTKLFTITGTPSVAGTFGYTVTTAGPCNNTSVSGTLIVSPNATITLTSPVGTSAQTVCINLPIVNITYSISGSGSGASITSGALPDGVTGSFNGGIFTISGTPTKSGAFSYTVTTSGSCLNASLSGTITVNPNATITLTSATGTDAQTKCINNALTNITYTVGGGATGASVVPGTLPAGVTSSFNSGIFTLSGTPTASGTFNYTVTTTGPCGNASLNGTITVSPVSVRGSLAIAGATPSNVKILCPSVDGFPPNTATINLTGNVGTVTWQSSTNGGTSWQTAVGAASQTSLVVTKVPVSTIYRAISKSGPCSADTSAIAIIDVIPPYVPAPVMATPDTVCFGQSTMLTAEAGYPTPGIPANQGKFENGASDSKIWNVYVNGALDGNALNAGGDNGSPTPWRETVGNNYKGYQAPDPKFAITHGVFNTILESPVFSLIGQPSASLTFIQSLDLKATDTAKIEISTDGGLTYQTLVLPYNGPTTVGGPKNFIPMNIDLSSYIGQSNLRVRFNFRGKSGDGVWAIDGLSTPGVALPINYTWSGNILSSTTGDTVTATPQTIGLSTYYITTTVGGCPGGKDTIQIYADEAVSNVTLTKAPFCLGNNASFVSSASGSNLKYQWQVNTGSGWTNLTNTIPYKGVTTTTMTVDTPGITKANYLYQVNISNACGIQAAQASLPMLYVWLGKTSTDWNTASNWSAGILPSTDCPNVHIPFWNTNQPTLNNSPVPRITNLIIYPNAIFTHEARIKIGGNITQNGTWIATKGTLEMNGTSTQNIKGSYFANKVMWNLTDSNNSVGGLNVTGTNDSLKLTGTLDFGPLSNATLHTGDNIVLISTAGATARVADITNNGVSGGNKFDGKVTVERYFPGQRSWRFLTSPLSGTGSIFETWQGSARLPYMPGRDMFVSAPPAYVGPATGIDDTFYDNWSMFTFNPATGGYVGVNSTKAQQLSPGVTTPANIGYFTFVRGDRNRNPDNSIFPNTNETTLSSNGNLQINNQTFTMSTGANSFALIGNPYASAVDFTKLTFNNVFNKRFYVWDPNLGTLGGFVTMENFNNPLVFTGTPATVQNNHIQSSQAFFVQVVTGGGASLMFKETDKSTDDNRQMFRPATPWDQRQKMNIKLSHLGTNGKTLLMDAILAEFDDAYEAKVDIMDAYKIFNITENLGFLRNGSTLSVERRPVITADDTLYLRITRTTARNYRFDFEPMNLAAGLTAFLEDSYTGLKTPLKTSANSSHDFVVNGDARSAAATRFRIVFKQVPPPPVFSFTSIKAYEQSSNIAVEWKVENELGIKSYELQKSTDGVNFIKMYTTMANGASAHNYGWMDIDPNNGNNYYRVLGLGKDSGVKYSSTVMVKMVKAPSGIRVYPNPVTTGTITMEFKYMEQGIYKTRLMNGLGQTIVSKTINHAPGTSMEKLQPDYKLAAGIYQLEITAPNKTVSTMRVIIK